MENFNPNGRRFSLGLNFGSVSGGSYAIDGFPGGCWVIFGLCWAFVVARFGTPTEAWFG